MKTLNNSTIVPDIIWYMVLAYKDANMIDYMSRFGGRKLVELTKDEFCDYAEEAFKKFMGMVEIDPSGTKVIKHG